MVIGQHALIFINYLGLQCNLLRVSPMKIKTDLVLSSINDTVFALLNNVSFVSAASITDSSVAVQQHTVMIPDDIVAHVIINTDTCLLSISGT